MLENWLTPFKPIFSNMPNILLIWVLHRNWLISISQFFILCPIFNNIGNWDAYVPPIHILKDSLGSSLHIDFFRNIILSPPRNIHPWMTLHIILKKRGLFSKNILTYLRLCSLWISVSHLLWIIYINKASLNLHIWDWGTSFSIALNLMHLTTHATQNSCPRYTKTAAWHANMDSF